MIVSLQRTTVRTSYKLLQQSHELHGGVVSHAAKCQSLESSCRRTTRPCQWPYLRSYVPEILRGYFVEVMVADQSSTNPIYRPLPIPYDYGWQAFKFVNPLITRATCAAHCCSRSSPSFCVLPLDDVGLRVSRAADASTGPCICSGPSDNR